MTLYQILEVDESAQEQEIKRAWAKKVKVFSPDSHPEENHRLSEAKATLLDPIARADYDAQLKFGDEISDLMEEADEAMEAEDFAHAASLFREVLALHPCSLDAMNRLGLVLLYQKQFSESVKIFEKLVSRAPGSALFSCNLAHAFSQWCDNLEELGLPKHLQSRQAEVYFRKAIELEHVNSSYYVSLAKHQVSQKKLAEAEATIEQGITADGKVDLDDIDAFMFLSTIYLLQGRLNELEKVVVRVKTALPEDVEIQRFAAYRFLNQARFLYVDHKLSEVGLAYVKAAKGVCNDLGDLKELADTIERVCTLHLTASRMIADESIEPQVVPTLIGVAVLARIGERTDERTVNMLIEAVGTWSRSEIAGAVDACRRKYRLAVDEVPDLVPTMISASRQDYVANHTYQSVSTSSSSSGCLVVPVTFVLIGLLGVIVQSLR